MLSDNTDNGEERVQRRDAEPANGSNQRRQITSNSKLSERSTIRSTVLCTPSMGVI
jgi:hypothetical protein